MEYGNNPFLGMKDVGQAEEILNQYRRDHQNDLSGAEKAIRMLLDALFSSDEPLTGDANDFHNFSVSIAKIMNDNGLATKIVIEGLKIHRINTDLLADAIKYGYNCGMKKECAQWYEILCSIDKAKWTWRAFSFSIDYLLDEFQSSGSNAYTIQDIFNLAEEYKKALPDEEDAWLSEQKIYRQTNQEEKGVQVLEDAIAKFNFCPKCWLRYADIMMDQGHYEKAEPIIQKMRRNPKTTESINTSYLYFIDGQCKMWRLINTDEYEEGEVEDRAVMKVYIAFRLSLHSPGLRESTKQQIEEYIDRLTMETGINFPDGWRV